jgi:hypothetical protein
MSGDTKQFWVKGSDTLLEFKKAIQDACKFPIEDQCLFVGGKVLTNDSASVDSCGIGHGKLIRLYARMPSGSMP